jgi:hypothetical protein
MAESRPPITDLFEDMGKQVENMNLANSAADSEGDKLTLGGSAEDDDVRVVDEIESLCMNCGENVSQSRSLHVDHIGHH